MTKKKPIARLVQVGDTLPTNSCGEIIVIQVESYKEITVRFVSTGTTRVVNSANIRRGSVKDLRHPSVCGVGYYGIGPYKAKVDGKHTKQYKVWRAMVNRCYGKDKRLVTYRDCLVCKNWLDFQEFGRWFDKTYPVGLESELMQLDKDVLSGGTGKLYSPETCCWIPRRLNILLTDSMSSRGEFPLGVVYHEKRGMFDVAMSNNKSASSQHIGSYSCPIAAFEVYKRIKEAYIKSETTKYKGILPDKVYLAFMRYQIVDDSPYEAHLKIKE